MPNRTVYLRNVFDNVAIVQHLQNINVYWENLLFLDSSNVCGIISKANLFYVIIILRMRNNLIIEWRISTDIFLGHLNFTTSSHSRSRCIQKHLHIDDLFKRNLSVV